MLRVVPHTVPRVGRSYEHLSGGFEPSTTLEHIQGPGTTFFFSSSLLLSSLQLSDTKVCEPQIQALPGSIAAERIRHDQDSQGLSLSDFPGN